MLFQITPLSKRVLSFDLTMADDGEKILCALLGILRKITLRTIGNFDEKYLAHYGEMC